MRGDGVLSDLLWRADCVCCGAACDRQRLPRRAAQLSALGSELCPACAGRLQRQWLVLPALSGGVPVLGAGRYRGPHRALVIAAKERLRPAAQQVAGRVFAAGVRFLFTAGYIFDAPVVLVPAPTRKSAARKRGGDVVTTIAEHAVRACAEYEWLDIRVVPVGWLAETTRDSVGLGRQERRENLSRAFVPNPLAVRQLRQSVRQGVQVVLVDDVMTTGATLSYLAGALAAQQIPVAAAVVLAAA